MGHRLRVTELYGVRLKLPISCTSSATADAVVAGAQAHAGTAVLVVEDVVVAVLVAQVVGAVAPVHVGRVGVAAIANAATPRKILLMSFPHV
jgi:hypothetical protein